MKDAEFPEFYSQNACDIVASKYFRRAGVPVERKSNGFEPYTSFSIATRGENSLKDCISRMVGHWTYWANKMGIFEDVNVFKDEMTYILLHQYWSPNSPQWFNAGLNWAYGIKPAAHENYYTIHGKYSEGCYEQMHACFLQPIEDSMFGKDSIFELLNNEARIFKKGSGSGTNFSNLRGKGERLSGGGKSSGVLSYLKIFDECAGSIKSGGVTRRSASMRVLDLDHPDVIDFIEWKSKEETKVASLITGSKINKHYLDAIVKDPDNDKLKALALQRGIESNYIDRAILLAKMGYSEFPLEIINNDFNGEGYQTVSGQNSNNTVSITDLFFKCLEEDLDWHLISRLPSKNQDEDHSFKESHPQGIVSDNGRIKINGKYYDITKTILAKDLMDKIALNAWQSADPGVHFRDTINQWNTCLNDGEITTSNPCSEVFLLDNTACNLGSHKVTKYLDNGEFNVRLFEQVVYLSHIVLDITNESALLPSEGIAQGTKRYRPTGNGLMDVGALLMKMGIPYDSDKGRAWIGALTSVMTATCYIASADLAKELGAYEAFRENAIHHSKVIDLHREASGTVEKKSNVKMFQINDNLLPKDLYSEVCSLWSHCVCYKYFRNSHVTCLAPTGCLVPDSMIITNSGLIDIGDIGNKNGDKWQDISLKVNNDKDATKFYVNGLDSCVTISSKDDYRISGTLLHRIKVLDENNNHQWKRLSDIKVGDIAPIHIGGIISGNKDVRLPILGDKYHKNNTLNVPESMNKDLAEFIGYFMGDGSLHEKGIRLCVTNEDDDVIDRLKDLSYKLFNIYITTEQCEGYICVYVNSVPLTRWWIECGFNKIKPNEDHIGKGFTPHIPKMILSTNDKEIYCSFLRGLFEADGTVNIDSGVQSLSTSSESFYYSLKSMLLLVGLPTHRHTGKSGLGEGDLYRIVIPSKSFAIKYSKIIGFISKRKTDKQCVSVGDKSHGCQVYISNDTLNKISSFSDKFRIRSYRKHGERNIISRSCAEEYVIESGDKLDELNYIYSEIESVSDIFESETFDISVPDGNTYIANGFISHNTISIQCDADTSGIEPDFSLIKYKKMSGGGYLKMVNGSIHNSLKSLGYDEITIKNIHHHIEKTGSIKGSSIKKEHEPIFHCANDISWKGHVLAVAAAQPMLSGGISKTINMPHDATIEDIKEAYLFSYQHGLKCNAVYRDGSKLSQPLNISLKEEISTSMPSIEEELRLNTSFEKPRGTRIKPLSGRSGFTEDFIVSGYKYYLRHNINSEGSLCELWIDAPNESSSVRTALNTMCRFLSKGLQYGMPVEEVCDTLIGIQQAPNGLVIHDNIKVCKSIYDAVGKFIAYRYLGQKEMADVESLHKEDLITVKADVKLTVKKTVEECPRCSSHKIAKVSSCSSKCSICGYSWGGCGE